MFTFKVFQLLPNGQLTNAEFLGEVEFDEWMGWAYGRYGQVLVYRTDGKAIVYMDDGNWWDKNRTITGDLETVKATIAQAA